MNKRTKKGFTIVELVIVIAVIGILAAVLIPTFSGVIDRANRSAALQEATSVMKSTLAMSDTASLSAETIFAIGDTKGIKYEFLYKGNKITERPVNSETKKYETLTPSKGGETIPSGIKYDRIIVNDKMIVGNDWSTDATSDSTTVQEIIKDAFDAEKVNIVSKDQHEDSNAAWGCELELNDENNTKIVIAVYVNSDYPTDAVTFIPATQENDVTGGD